MWYGGIGECGPERPKAEGKPVRKWPEIRGEWSGTLCHEETQRGSSRAASERGYTAMRVWNESPERSGAWERNLEGSGKLNCCTMELGELVCDIGKHDLDAGNGWECEYEARGGCSWRHEVLVLSRGHRMWGNRGFQLQSEGNPHTGVGHEWHLLS